METPILTNARLVLAHHVIDGVEDRGEVAPGQRAGFVRFRVRKGAPVIRDVWRGGEKVA